MPFNKGFQFGIKENPLIKSVYNQISELGELNPPPPSLFIITENSELMLNEDGNNNLITQ
jgi:hypothetical protein